MIVFQSLNPSYTLKPFPRSGTTAWTVHAHDGFNTQIGRDLERLPGDRWRLSFGPTCWVETESEQEMKIMIQGIMIGRCVC